MVRADGVAMTDLLGGEIPAGAGVTMGYAVFPPGTVVPPAAHTGDEYSFILSGTVKCEAGGVVHTASAGMATFIPAGETHSSFNDGGDEGRHASFLFHAGSSPATSGTYSRSCRSCPTS